MAAATENYDDSQNDEAIKNENTDSQSIIHTDSQYREQNKTKIKGQQANDDDRTNNGCDFF